MVTTKTSAPFTSTVNAIIIAPNTINGERKNKRKKQRTQAKKLDTGALFLYFLLDLVLFDIIEVIAVKELGKRYFRSLAKALYSYDL